MRTIRTIGVLALFLLVLGGAASAAQPTRLHINITETVNQNVTFAENFDLVSDTKSCLIIGKLNISNPGAETVSDIYLTFSQTLNMSGNFTHESGRSGSQVSGVAPGDNYVVLIPELRGGNYTLFNYTVNCSDVEPPLAITTSYSSQVAGIDRKVLAGSSWTINQSIENQLGIGETINDINITIETLNVTWNVTSDDFQFSGLYPLGDYAYVTGNGTSTSLWWWKVNNGSLAFGNSAFIMYNVTAPDNIPTSATYAALRETLQYEISRLASNLTLENVTAIADLEFSLDKRIVRPADNDQSNNVTWEVDADITVPFNVSYNLTQVSVWVTKTLDPTDTDVSPYGDGGYLNQTYNPLSEVNQTTPWSMTEWYFNYSDASDNATARPPIVWLRPYFTIINAQNQILNSTITRSGTDIYMKYIYIVNGYWLQVDKNITSVGEDRYQIDTLVENIGNAWTPEGLVVTVYDFVPSEFAPYGWTMSPDSNSPVAGGDFNGTAYRWTIGLKSPLNSSLGPSTESYLNRTWNTTYYVNGSGDYQVSELYIVGLDPRKVDGAGTHEGITVLGAFGSASAEVFYLTIVLFLIIINVVNFVMTRRINDKLNRK
ncbi:hypothetical protein JXA12_03230 [Candidatus Woesearchaeota archaeon]|nr:hypothetical protein [Candidatus Woesearchaeota archaeon]